MARVDGDGLGPVGEREAVCVSGGENMPPVGVPTCRARGRGVSG
ncbi:hypothetical protein GA0115252_136212, partial [Streptomyces sp. DfronAA-171]